jgi:hypothetical protein
MTSGIRHTDRRSLRQSGKFRGDIVARRYSAARLPKRDPCRAGQGITSMIWSGSSIASA